MQWESSYDPEIHCAPWHNDNPFVLEEYHKRVKKCRVCATPFVDRNNPAPKFVVSHNERRIFWTKQGTTRLRAKKVIYHCSLSCNYATPSILQDSRADGSTHRRSQVDCRRRPGGRVRRRGLVIRVNERLLERYCLRHCYLFHTCVRWHYRTVFSALIIRLLIFST